MPTIFISHRHVDSSIADAIALNLKKWGVPKDWLYQSSAPNSGPIYGARLRDELHNTLSDKQLLIILIYTRTDHNWEYCMYECGVAIGRNSGARIVIFQCSSDEPRVFEDVVRVTLDQKDIIRFTEQFHHQDGFIPNRNAFGSGVDPGVILERADSLIADLVSELSPFARPRVQRDLCGSFRLSMAAEVVRQLKADESDNLLDEICGKCRVEEANEFALTHFGFAAFDERLNWIDLRTRWITENIGGASTIWIQDFEHELSRAVQNRRRLLACNCMKSVCPGYSAWFHLIIRRVHMLPTDAMEFDVHLHPVEEPPHDH